MVLVQLSGLGAGVGQQENGAVSPNKQGTIVLHNTSTPVPIYTDETGLTVLSTGAFVTDSQGRIPGWAELGLYVDISIPPADTVATYLPGPPNLVSGNIDGGRSDTEYGHTTPADGGSA